MVPISTPVSSQNFMNSTCMWIIYECDSCVRLMMDSLEIWLLACKSQNVSYALFTTHKSSNCFVTVLLIMLTCHHLHNHFNGFYRTFALKTAHTVNKVHLDCSALTDVCTLWVWFYLWVTFPHALERVTTFSLIGRRGPNMAAGSISKGIWEMDKFNISEPSMLPLNTLQVLFYVGAIM